METTDAVGAPYLTENERKALTRLDDALAYTEDALREAFAEINDEEGTLFEYLFLALLQHIESVRALAPMVTAGYDIDLEEAR